MERKRVITCAGCGNTQHKLVKCCRITTAPKCAKGHDWSLAPVDCVDYKSRFTKKINRSKMEVELL